MEKIYKKRAPKTKYVQAIVLNILILGASFLFFEPTPKCDDYEMSLILYGACNGETSPFLLYSNFYLGCFLKWLLDVAPFISWYYVIQYIFLFVSLTMVSYILMKHMQNKECFLYLIVFLGIAAYEFYIRITFSKTAGLVMIAGLFWMYALIEQKSRCWTRYILAFFWVMCGCLFRMGMLLVVLAIFFGGFLIYCLKMFRTLKLCEHYEVGRTKSAYLAGVILFVGMTCMIYISGNILQKAGEQTAMELDNKSDYYISNSIRSSLVDYGWPDYERYKEEYTAIGVSENDYQMWAKQRNIADEKVLSLEKIKQIRSIAAHEVDERGADILRKALANMPEYFFSCAMSVLLLILCCYYALRGSGQARGNTLIILSTCMFAYLYMSYMGRLRHHVDICVFTAAILILLYNMGESEFDSGQSICISKQCISRVCVLGMAGILLSYIVANYSVITSSYYGNDTYGKSDSYRQDCSDNYERLSLLSEDDEHLYIMGAHEEWILYPCFSVGQVLEKNFYHNMFRLSQYAHTEIHDPLFKFGVTNHSPLSAIVDNEKMYYCISDERESKEIQIVEKYLQEHYNPKATRVLVKKVDGMNIYRFVSEPLQFRAEEKAQ